MKMYSESHELYISVDGDRFGEEIRQATSDADTWLSWRIEKQTQVMHIVEFFPEGKGYIIYKVTL